MIDSWLDTEHQPEIINACLIDDEMKELETTSVAISDDTLNVIDDDEP
jgi:hypothetical protein